MQTKFILFNAPKLAGKDFAINYLKSLGYPLQRLECKDHLHKLTMLFFNVSHETYWSIYNDRSIKEAPLKHFKLSEIEYFRLFNYLYPTENESIFGKLELVHPEYWISIRHAMIYVSELLCKPAFGEDYFGTVRAENIQQGLYVDGSCGFPEELPPLIVRLGQNNIFLMRIHRKGHTFEGDSRGYISDGVVDNTIDIYNNGTEEEYLDNITDEIRRFLK